ncbi:MAG TPA: PD-(D/E)XK nuclease family protein [Thermoanaerobaculia bacterium]|nr:PD-(D/E)XK nuclease family protein [Thermoanaerobaculia bacterium]
MTGRIAELAEEARRDPALLARPVRVVVPSRSLRAHVAAALVRSRSLAGVRVQTLHGLAFEILERAGETPPRGRLLAEVLAQRYAAAEPKLRDGLGDLVDGYGAVAGTVRDLLDAGLEPVHAEAAEEALALDGTFRAAVERARALVRVAARTEADLRRRGLGTLSTLLRRATDLLEADPEAVLPSRALLVHGFADATGVASDLLQSLLRRHGAWLVLDRPPSWQGEGVESAFTERLALRLSSVASIDEPPPPPLADIAPPRIERFQAPGVEAEAREIARRARVLIDSGVRPEAIGIVARDLSGYRLPLARHLRRLGVPFSALGTRGAIGPAGRRARAFLELLRRGEEVPADRWLDAVANLPGAVDLRLAFASLGAGRLRDVSMLRPELFLRQETDSYPLPIRHGLREQSGREGEEVEVEEGEAEVRAIRRHVHGERIRAAVRLAGRVRERLGAWPEEAPAKDHLSRLKELLEILGWKGTDPALLEIPEALEAIGREVPSRFVLDRDELRRMLAGELEDAGTAELGGAGGGVQVLTAMEARGRTFDHLFLAGLNRDVFPRGVREDPLLPDDLRRVIQRVIPDVPVKLGGFDEERWLFSHLLSSSPEVTLSWQSMDEDGKAVSASPLLRDVAEAPRVPPLWSREAVRQGPRTAAERAVLAGLHGSRSDLSLVLPLAVGNRALAAARLAVLDEIDPDLRTPEGRAARARLGPYFGFVGRAGVHPLDPRRRDLFVTHLESLASCPWQLFLQRLLRLEPTPDPLQMAPGSDPLLLGNLVHAVLERIVKEAGTPENGKPVLVPWPAEEELRRLVEMAAIKLLEKEGIFLNGLAWSLAEQVAPRLDAARDSDWAEGPVRVLRAEDEGALQVLDAEGRSRSVCFRADRVDLLEDGTLRRTDYKTGKPISDKKKEEVRRRHFLAKVRAGSHLQGVAYYIAGDGHGKGRYLFLRPELEDDLREFSVGPADRDLIEAFAAAVRAVLAAWDAGSFFPRVVDPAVNIEPGRCKVCEVAEACIRGDSGARTRLFEWANRMRGARDLPAATPAETALLEVWRLPDKNREEPSE